MRTHVDFPEGMANPRVASPFVVYEPVEVSAAAGERECQTLAADLRLRQRLDERGRG